MFSLQKIDDHRIEGNKIIQGSTHTSLILNHKERNKITVRAVCNLRKISDTFDSIACCGTSGLLVVPNVASLLEKHLIVVRKKAREEKRYSIFDIEGVVPNKYIIIDDLICSGQTVRHIIQSLKKEAPRSQCVGVYCYIPKDCAYSRTEEGIKAAKRDLRIEILNPIK